MQTLRQPVLQREEDHGVVDRWVIGVAGDAAAVERQDRVDLVGCDHLKAEVSDLHKHLGGSTGPG